MGWESVWLTGIDQLVGFPDDEFQDLVCSFPVHSDFIGQQFDCFVPFPGRRQGTDPLRQFR